MMQGPRLVCTLCLLWLVTSCATTSAQHQATLSTAAFAATRPLPTSTAGGITATPSATTPAVANALPTPTSPWTRTPRAATTTPPSPTATLSPSATPTLVPCLERVPDDDLLILVNRTYGLSRDYEPRDLVPLSSYFPNAVTLGYPTEVRAVIIEPLQDLIAAMQDEGLAPQIISGYRSYSAQALALRKWLEQYPEWAMNLSALPGYSEHQLGTTVDFGSPELRYIIDEENLQFHPAFVYTSEGKWLAAHAHEYGFTLSYPDDAFERTEFIYEPWHYRYVGVELATQLVEQELTISEYLLATQPPPCIP